jgi:hypothetical protein
VTPKTVTLTGWKAVVVLVALVGVVGVRVATARARLDTEGREALRAWVVGEVQRGLLADTTLGLRERGDALLRAGTIAIESLDARGPLDDTVVRVRVAPNAAYPSDTELVRYYRMQFSEITGWTYHGRTNRVGWVLALF